MYEAEIVVPVKLVGVPNDVVLTTDIQDSLHITIRDKGLAIWGYKRHERQNAISVDFSSHISDNGNGAVTVSGLTKYIHNMFKSSHIVSVKPERLDFFYSDGSHTKVPVKFAGSVLPSQMSYLSEVKFSPDSVQVIADKKILENIDCATINPIRIRNFSDTTVMKVKLAPVTAVKFVPSEVIVTLYPDVYTEDELSIPITCLNLPKDKRLVTFPSRAKVRYIVGLKKIRTVSQQDFVVETDYNDIIECPDAKRCRLVLRSVPQNVNRARLVDAEVEYLIESI